MNIKCYKGLTPTGSPVYENDIYRYTITESRLSVLLKGTYPTLNMKYNDLISIEIEDETTGNLSLSGRFISLNYVVYDDPQGTSTVVADNSILFELF